MKMDPLFVAALFGSMIIMITVSQIFLWIFKEIKYRSMVNKIPGPKFWPFIGFAMTMAGIKREDRLNWFTKLAFQFKQGIYLIWIGNDPLVHIRKPHQLELILPSVRLITKSRAYDVIKPWLGNGLLTSTGDKWFHHRKLITPAFHYGIFEEFASAISEKVDILNEILETAVRDNPGKPLNICDFIVRCTLDILCETSMNFNLDAQRDTGNEYTSAVHKFTKLFSTRFIWPWQLWDWYYFKTQSGKEFKQVIKVMHEFTTKIIEYKKKERNVQKVEQNHFYADAGIRKRKAFLDLLLEESEKNKHPLSDREIREEVDTFMFAGHDTTMTAISWSLFALGNTPNIQEKVRHEIFEQFGDSVKPSTTKQLAELKYMDRVIKEVLRIYPSVPFIMRHLTHDVDIDGYTVPKGTSVQIDIFRLHHDPEVWENPETFDPDRFLPENSVDRHPYAYVPFSAGPRNCLGQKFALLEIKATLVAILRKWNVKSAVKYEEMKMCCDVVLRPADTIDLYLRPLK